MKTSYETASTFYFPVHVCSRKPLVFAQAKKDTATTLFRIYEDNDFINIYMKGTDNAYTNGTRFDLFYLKKNKPRFFVDRAMPKAGDSSINIYGWGITQLMFTPNNIATAAYQQDDYPYAGALFATHTLYSYNPAKKYDLQTELVAGMSGPASFAQQVQTFIHSVISYKEPLGWNHQAKNKFLLNINFTAEKQLAAHNGWLEVLVGGQAYAGTMMNAATVYPELRIGKMQPYFKGYISQYANSRRKGNANRVQAYLFAKPQTFLVITNQLIQGRSSEITSGSNKNGVAISSENAYPPGINNLVYAYNYGAVVSTGHFSISFTQNAETTLLKGLYSHKVGNFSLYFSW